MTLLTRHMINTTQATPAPWIVSGIVALILFELDAANYLILLGAVLAGLAVAIYYARRGRG